MYIKGFQMAEPNNHLKEDLEHFKLQEGVYDKDCNWYERTIYEFLILTWGGDPQKQ
jgi:hypothetical protein